MLNCFMEDGRWNRRGSSGVDTPRGDCAGKPKPPVHLVFRSALLLLALAVSVGCVSTPQSRAARNPASFDRLSPPVRERVLEGRIALGDDEETVLLAWGVPTRRAERLEAEGRVEVWLFERAVPEWRFGFGFAQWGRHADYGTHLEASLPPRRRDAWRRVEFRDGQVVRIDSARDDRPRRRGRW